MKIFPFSFIPINFLRKIQSRFYGLARSFNNLFPEHELKLRQTDLDLRKKDYLSLCFASFFYNLLFFSGLIFVLTFVVLQIEVINSALISSLVAISFSFFAFFIQLYYPTVKALRKERKTKEELIFALRNMLVRLRAGVPVYQAMMGVSEEDFGIVSKEFEKTVGQIEKGKSQLEALEDMAIRNPSKYFKRVIWQISNSIRSGANVADTIATMVRNLSQEQLIEIRNYGNTLSPIAMMYMMVSVIIPTLGTTMMIILGSFLGLNIPKIGFYGVIVLVVFLQFVFLSIIKSSRPPTGI